MKKKKLTLLLLLFICFISCLSNAQAFQIGETFSRKSTLSSPKTIKLYDKDGNEYDYLDDVYTATYSGDNEDYTIYCVDPVRSEGKAGDEFKITDVFIEGNKNANQKAEDFGLAKILTTEASDGDFQTSGLAFDYAKSLALRIFYNGHTSRAYSAGNNSKRIIAYEALDGLAKDFAADGVDESIYVDGDTGVIHDAAVLYRIGLAAEKSYTASTIMEITSTSREIDVEENKEDNQDDESFTFNPNGEAGSSSSETTSKEVLKRHIVTVTIKNFNPSESEFSFTSFSGGSSGVLRTRVIGISTENTTDFSKYTTPFSTSSNVIQTFKNAIKTDENGNNTLVLYIAVETKGTIVIENGSANCENCQDNPAVFSFAYSDPSVLIGAEIHRSMSSSGFQRFLVASKSKNENTGTIEFQVDGCSKYCPNGGPGGPDNPPIDDPCKPVECEGDDCLFNATLPQICSDDATLTDDGLVEYKFIEAYTGQSYDVVKCILKAQKDSADNPYLLTDNDNAEAVSDNNYCSVLCKEDYSLRLPYKQIVEEGRYFKVSLSIKGQQDCYSTKIDNEAFEEDIKAKEKEIVNAINVWNVYYELVNGTETDLSINDETVGCKSYSCTYSSSDSSCSKKVGEIIPSNSITKKKFFFGHSTVIYYGVNDLTGAVTAIPVNSTNLVQILDSPSQTLLDDINRVYGSLNSDPSDSATCERKTNSCNRNDPNCQPYTCEAKSESNTCVMTRPIDDYNNHKADYRSKLANAQKEVENKVQELKEIIDEYNSCVGDKNYQALADTSGNTFWNMIYHFNPEIKYSYDEPDPTTPSRSKWIDDVASLDCDGTPCNTLYSTDEEILAEDCPDNSPVKCTEIGANGTFKSVFYDGDENGEDDAYANTYCIGDINDDYSCQGTTLHSLDSAYSNKTFFVCNFNSGSFNCSNTVYPVTNVNYVHKSAVASGKYDSRPVYYTEHHSGDIRIMYPEQDTLNYSQVPGLPVSADTPQGTYIYILGLENIGTFYNTGELGRIYGSKSNSLATKVRLDSGATSATFPVTTGTGENATDSDVEIKVNEYACTYVVSQSSCQDNEGQLHTSDECQYGTLDKNWNECQKRICGTDPVPDSCIDKKGVVHSKSECSQDETWDECQERLCDKENPDNPDNPDDLTCTDQNNKVHYGSECNDGESWEACQDRICPNPPNTCVDYTDHAHSDAECKPGETWKECEQRLCPNVCYDNDNNRHTQDECNPGESWDTCQERICPNPPNVCYDDTNHKHTDAECDFGESWETCQDRICNTNPNPSDEDLCTENNVVHKKSECKPNEDEYTCKQRLCPGSEPNPDENNYCVKEAQSYYICSSSTYSKETCIKANSREEAIANTKINYNCCPNCEVVCVGKCLYVFPNNKTNDGEVQFQFRPVSPNNMNPNSRPLGYNWDLHNPSNSLIAQKATDTIYEIESRASSTTSQNDDYTLSVNMTPDMVTYIKKYNNEQLSQGAYNNDTLNCYDYELEGYDENTCQDAGYIWKDNKCIMSKVFCYSTFIDSLIENFPNEIEAPNREESRNSSHSGFRPYTGIPNSSQEIVTNDYWTIYKFTEIDINGDGLPNIGPSWK